MSAMYDPSRVSLKLNSIKIDGLASGSDSISLARNEGMGSHTFGLDGRGVWVHNTNKSGQLTIKLQQHAKANKILTDWANAQDDLLTSELLSLEIKDLINGDTVSGVNGRILTPTNYVRGTEHNDNTWVIEFERVSINLEEGK